MLPNCDNSAAVRPGKRSIPSRLPPALCIEGSDSLLPAASVHLNVEIPDLLAQRVAVEAEQVGRADLVAAGGGQRRGQQRHLDLLQDAVIKARRRHTVRET